MKKLLLCAMVFGALILAATVSYSQTAFWQAGTAPAAGNPINALAVNASGDIFAATNGSGLFRSTNNGTSWSRIDTGFTMQNYYYSIAIDKRNRIFVGGYRGLVYKTTNNGATWKSDTLHIDSARTSKSLVTSFAFNEDGYVFAGTGGDGIFVLKSDTAKTWRLLKPGIDNKNVFPIVVDSLQNLYAGTYGSGVYTSQDTGRSWLPYGPGSYRVNALAYGANSTLFAATDDGIFIDSLKNDTISTSPLVIRKVDAGWAPATLKDTLGNIVRVYVVSLAATPGGHIFAGTMGYGIYRSTDNGASWKPTNRGLTDANIVSLVATPSRNIIAGSNDGSIYVSAQAEPAFIPPVAAAQPSVSAVPVLEQNYPNPFNPTTVIPFTLPNTGFVRLAIYDALGREIARLVEGTLQAGQHEIRWDASNVPSGVYFYRFQSASTTQTGKLTLLK